MKESEEKSKSERLSGGSSRTGFKPNSLQSSKSSEVSAYKNLIKKHKVGELEAAACFIRTKTDAKYQSHSLKVKEEEGKTHNVLVHRSKEMAYDKKVILVGNKPSDSIFKGV